MEEWTSGANNYLKKLILVLIRGILKMITMKIACSIFVTFISIFTCAQTTYYVDNLSGDDGNDGTTSSSAFQKLEKVNELILQPGDSVLFKRGGKWIGTLRPQGSGTKGKRIVIGAFGKGDDPVIDAEGKSLESDFMSASILLFNQEYWEIRDIEVRNFEKGNPDKPSEKAGILVLAKDVGTLHDFKFENVKISHVNGSLKTRENGGLFLNVITDSIPEKRVPTNFDGIYVNNCHFFNVDRGGFLNQSFWKNRDFDSKFGEVCKNGKVNNWYPNKNILIENCRFEDVGGNGLVTRVAESPVVQNNLFVKCSSRTTGNASYPYNCNNALWQYNEACYTIYNEGDVDASGFDSDYLCKNTTIQYNYSHHNDWGGLLVCSWGKLKNAFNDGTIVRNNIFQNEKHHMIRFSGNITNTLISDNLFISDSEIDDGLLWYKHWGEIWPDKTVLKDNIFYNLGAKKFLLSGESGNNTFSENSISGVNFSDCADFKKVKDHEKLESKIEKIKKTGARKEFVNSKAGVVTDIMWGAWYTQGNFKPKQRIEFTLTNTLDIDRENCPVIIKRENFPLPDLHEMWVTVVDPDLPSYEGPSEELLRLQGGHQMRAETNGHAIYHQMDDLDKDGIWDELFFQTDIKAHAEKTIYIYMGENTRGWNKHYTHANIGSYCRHLMPFWESENIGWKIWFANACDVFAKRKPVLMSSHLYVENMDGYAVSARNRDWGSDIQGVAGSLGGGGICLFENPDEPATISLPRYTPAKAELAPKSLWNAGQISDTRYAYEVVVNGPIRSIIKIKGMNWDSGNGLYEYEQYYTVYAHQSYCTSKVIFTTFLPKTIDVKMGCGFKKKPDENHFIQEEGIIISGGPEAIKDPENIDDREEYIVDFIGTALVVKDEFKPEYQFVEEFNGNHTFKIGTPKNNTFEFMLSSAWSEGAVYNTKDKFAGYIRNSALGYNNPLVVKFVRIQEK